MVNAVFMSIKEVHMNRIIQQIKNHEFRTQKPKNKIDYITVYIPTPMKELKYILKVKEPLVTPNKILIDGYGNERFNEESIKKYAHPIENVYEIKHSIKLTKLRNKFNFTAPQSFAYGEKYKSLLKYIDKVGFKKIY